MHEGNFQTQVRLTFENPRTALEEFSASLSDVVKLGAYFVDVRKLPDYGAVQAEFFKGNIPAQTAVEVSSLELPGMLIEVEAIAVI